LSRWLIAFICSVGLISIRQSSYIDERRLKAEQREQHCLAKNVFYEAGNQSLIGKVAVAHVTLNRLRSKQQFHCGSICDVVYQRKQFSWTMNRHHESRTQKDWRWRESIDVAKKCFKSHQDPTGGALFFHTKRVRPYWSQKKKRTVTIGDHIFYK